MKEAFLNYSINLLNKEYHYSGELLDRVKYGLEIIYISVTKISVILFLSIIFNLFKETLLFSIFITPLRTFSYGIHAKKSWHCYVSSILIFIFFPYVFIKLNFNYVLKIFICLFSFISMLLYAPADTYKRPLVNINHRKKLKLFSLIITISYIILIFITKKSLITNLLILSLITQSLLINPFVYKIFNLPYNNYKVYQKNAANLQK